MARNVVNIEEVSKAFDIKELLIGVSLGVSEAIASALLVEMAQENPRS